MSVDLKDPKIEGEISISDMGLLYDLYFDKLYKFFYYKVLSKEIAEDLTSETFLTFASVMKDNKQINNPKYYLFGIAKNIFLKFLKRKYKQEIPLSLIGDNFEEYATKCIYDIESRDSFEDKLLKYLNQIPEKQKIVLQMRLIDKMSLKEIAVKLGKNMNYVKTTQKRALKSIKNLVPAIN
jgi:RNA polymerase sigma-70 factor, ECF subfamily